MALELRKRKSLMLKRWPMTLDCLVEVVAVACRMELEEEVRSSKKG
jgi:hypothetical protein